MMEPQDAAAIRGLEVLASAAEHQVRRRTGVNTAGPSAYEPGVALGNHLYCRGAYSYVG